jgi:hypothetical protein
VRAERPETLLVEIIDDDYGRERLRIYPSDAALKVCRGTDLTTANVWVYEAMKPRLIPPQPDPKPVQVISTVRPSCSFVRGKRVNEPRVYGPPRHPQLAPVDRAIPNPAIE